MSDDGLCGAFPEESCTIAVEKKAVASRRHRLEMKHGGM